MISLHLIITGHQHRHRVERIREQIPSHQQKTRGIEETTGINTNLRCIRVLIFYRSLSVAIPHRDVSSFETRSPDEINVDDGEGGLNVSFRCAKRENLSLKHSRRCTCVSKAHVTVVCNKEITFKQLVLILWDEFVNCLWSSCGGRNVQRFMRPMLRSRCSLRNQVHSMICGRARRSIR